MLKRYLPFLLLALVSTAVSLGALYWLSDGSPGAAITRAKAPSGGAASPSAGGGDRPSQEEILERVAALEQRLKTDWEDGEGWKMLGRSYMALGRYRDAVSAWSQAATLLPRDPEINSALQALSNIAAERGKHEEMKADN